MDVEGALECGESSGSESSGALWLFCGADAGKDGRSLSAASQRECNRESARRQHSRIASRLQHGTRHRPARLGDYHVTPQNAWPKIAVVGAGAVGGYFGGMLARAGAPVVMIGRPAFVEAV